MRGYLMSILGVMAIMVLALAAFQEQADAQAQQEDEVAVVGLFEQEGSGFSGVATLRSTASQQQGAAPEQQQPPAAEQTEVIVGIVSESDGTSDGSKSVCQKCLNLVD